MRIHIGAVEEVAKRLNITELYIDPADSAMYASPANCFPPYLPAAENLLTPSEWPPQTPDFEILHTPGHTPGGVCYYFREYNALFTGDTLFRASVGRTDFPGGDTATLMESISGRLMTPSRFSGNLSRTRLSEHNRFRKTEQSVSMKNLRFPK